MSLSRAAIAAAATFVRARRPPRPTSTGSTSAATPARARRTARASTGAKFDNKTGKLGEAELAAEMGSPSFVAIHPNGKFLYAVGEGEREGRRAGGGVRHRREDRGTDEAEREQERRVRRHATSRFTRRGRSPSWPTTAAEHGRFRLGEDGKIVERTAFIQHEGRAWTRAGRKGRMPTAPSSPDRQHAFIVDLGPR